MPGGPVSPWGPVAPVGPVGPTAPVGPGLPVAPAGPVGPVGPVTPVLPGRPAGPVALGAWNPCWPCAAGGTLGASRARGPWLPWGAGWPGGAPLPRWPGWAGRPLLPGGAGRSLRAGTATWPAVIIDVVAHTRAPFPSSIWRGGERVTKREGNASPSLQAGWLIRCSPPRCPGSGR